MRSNFRRLAGVATALALTAGLGACASAARPEAMVVLPSTTSAVVEGDFGYKSLRIINISGGTDTNPLLWSEVSSGAFRQALEDSLRVSGYLGSSETAPLQLTASLMDLRKPLAGFDLSVTSVARYTVRDASGEIIFDDTVSAVGTAKLGESFMAVERLRLANEYAIRENIKSFIERFRAQTRPAAQ